ncbi:EAL domain-containing protein [Pseudoalteromonas piscicida]|uniref:EAL domain-containing protein n=1 Tax=Pseudoalteromonas piscicida TaxID=43662 RepID=A0ABM6NJ62_PSEO7|nr:EAL domain-containing protein [Pseudoalteromonas piscicida]ATD08997.1 hypothetical protein PPIS_a4361 [Pseudoalteromonas piscicida]WPU30972.1 EAL domain-containing protein [Pseudoalteromonas piscicida]
MNTRSIAQPLKAKSRQPTAKATQLLGLTGYTSRLPVAWLVLASFIFLAALSIYVIANYYDTRRDIMARIDAQLINAATSANVIVGKKYHESPEHITPAEFKQKSHALTELARALNVEYVYTMVLKPPYVHFTASSYTREDLKLNRLTRYQDVYSEASITLKSAFHSTEPVFEIAKDKWGHFKSVFIPFVLPDGTTYIAGADLTIHDLESRLQESVMDAAIDASFFFVMFLVVVSLYFMYYKKTLTTDSRTGFGNRIALEQALKYSKSQHLCLSVVWVKELEDIISFYGTEVGDNVMAKVMSYFSEFTHPFEVYRLTTSKIALVTSIENGEHYLANLTESFPCAKPIYDAPHLYVNLCAGVAKGNCSLLLENAFLALRQAQQQNTQVCYFDSQLQINPQQQSKNLHLTRLLQSACESDRIIPFFTPRKACHDHADIQYHCTARVLNERGAIIDAEHFYPVMKQPKLRAQISMKLLELCVTRFRKSNHAWSMQLSHSEISDAEYFEYISQILRRYPQPQLITFEFNETDVLKNFSDMSLMMQSLKAKGANVAVTGVNSGFLTINRILKLPLDAICLEASICENLDEDEMLLSSIEYLASHCNAKRIDLIVPCVATSKQAKQLEAAGVARLEGSWIGKASGHL